MSFFTLTILLALIPTIQGAIKTSIYIDNVPGYSALVPCAQNRLSAIVRAQSSGCGDQQQLTSFSCFCIDMSTYMVSVISTAVQSYCAANATAATNATESASLTAQASITTKPPEVRSAVDVFNDYCARSTELALYQDNNKSSSTLSSLSTLTTLALQPTLSTLVITAAPSFAPTPAVSTTSSSAGPIVPAVVIAAPIAIGVLVIVGVVGLVFWLRKVGLQRTPKQIPPGELQPDDVYKKIGPPQEVDGHNIKYELETRPAELQETND